MASIFHDHLRNLWTAVDGMNLKRMRDEVTRQRLLQVVESYEGLPEEDEGGSLHDVAHRME